MNVRGIFSCYSTIPLFSPRSARPGPVPTSALHVFNESILLTLANIIARAAGVPYVAGSCGLCVENRTDDDSLMSTGRGTVTSSEFTLELIVAKHLARF